MILFTGNEKRMCLEPYFNVTGQESTMILRDDIMAR